MGKIEMEIKHNNTCVREYCGICGLTETWADIPYWVFVNGEPVCPDCIKQRNPVILEVLEDANRYFWEKQENLEALCK